jgi:hypothetical protein
VSRAVPVEADLMYERAQFGLLGCEARILLKSVSIELDVVERQDYLSHLPDKLRSQSPGRHMIDLTDQLGLRILDGKLGRTAPDAAEDRLHSDVAQMRGHRVLPLAQDLNAAAAVIMWLLTTVKLLRLPAIAFAVL